jgi:hypothetical protein
MPRRSSSAPRSPINLSDFNLGQKQQQSIVPAIVVQDDSKNTVYLFDSSLSRIVHEMNHRAGHDAFSVQREKQFEWSVMGSESRDYIMFTLDESLVHFSVMSLIPVHSEIVWHFTKSGVKYDIGKALHALFT